MISERIAWTNSRILGGQFGSFAASPRRRGADGPLRYPVREGATGSGLLLAIGVGAGADVTVAVNGELAARDTPLREGADVMVLSPMEGGAAGAATTSYSNRDIQIKK